MASTTGASSSSQLKVPLTPAEIPSQIDLLIALHLNLWTALTITVQNGWGTSNPQIGEDKRDWLAGAISDLFAQSQLRDLEDLEDVLEQVMSDEFEVVVDDGSLEEVSRKIWKGVAKVKSGEGSEVRELMAVWRERKQRGDTVIGIVKGETEDPDEESSSGSDDDGTQWNGFEDSSPATGAAIDVDMNEAPALVEVPRRPEPEVDEDGFTKVVSKKRR